MQKLLIATTNQGKFNEMKVLLHELPCELVFLGGLEGMGDVEENGKTFEENALIKARYFSEKTGLPALADDSGIWVDALAGELGVKTRRWGAGAKATDQEWIDFFLERMKDVPTAERTGKFVAAVAVVWPVNDDLVKEAVFRGETTGLITHELEAPIESGVPLSSCFRPEGCGQVYAALSKEEKGKLSHRGRAIMESMDFLRGCFAF